MKLIINSLYVILMIAILLLGIGLIGGYVQPNTYLIANNNVVSDFGYSCVNTWLYKDSLGRIADESGSFSHCYYVTTPSDLSTFIWKH